MFLVNGVEKPWLGTQGCFRTSPLYITIYVPPMPYPAIPGNPSKTNLNSIITFIQVGFIQDRLKSYNFKNTIYNFRFLVKGVEKPWFAAQG
jgi:hypothetical protein